MRPIALTIQQMKHLQALGVNTSKASMYYAPLPNGDMALKVSQSNPRYKYPAFTLQNILELLPVFIVKDGLYYDLTSDMHNSMAYKRDWDSIEDDELLDEGDFYLHTESDGSNLLKMAFKMLCWCAENGYLKNKEE